MPAERTIRVNVETSGMPGAFTAAAGTAAGAGAYDAQAEAMRAATEAAYGDAAAQAAAAAAAARAGEEAAASAPGFEAQADAMRGASDAMGQWVDGSGRVVVAAAASAAGVDAQASAARDSRDAFAVLDQIIREYDDLEARAAAASTQAGAAAGASSAGYDAQAEAMRAATEAAGEYAGAQEAAAAASARSVDMDQAEVDRLRAVTAAKIAVARAQQAVNQAYDEVTAGQITYLALSQEVSQETLRDAIAFGAAGSAARNYSEDTAASAAYMAQFGVDAERMAQAARDAGDADISLRDAERMLAEATTVRRAADHAAAQSAYDLAVATRQTDAAVRDAGNGAANARRLWGVLPLTWNAIHWAISGTAEALAVIIPAMVAAGSAAAVGMQGAVDVAHRMQAVYTATEATYRYLGKTISTGLGQNINQFTQSAGQAAGAGNRLRDSLQQAQNAAQPHVYELLGAAVNGANDKFGAFTTVGGQTIDMLDQFAAKMDIALQHTSVLNSLTRNAVPDLQGLGQVFGNIGHAATNAAGAMPGVAEALLRILDAGSRVLVWASHFQGVLMALFLGEAAIRWGGLVRGALGGIASAIAGLMPRLGALAGTLLGEGAAADAAGMAFSTMGANLEGAAAFMAGPWGLALAGAGVALTLLILKFNSAKDATQKWIASLEQTVSQATGLAQIGDTYAALQQVTAANAAAQQHLAQSSAQFIQLVHTQGISAIRTYSVSQAQVATDAGALSTAQQQLSQDFSNEIGNVKLLSSEYKIGYAEAAQLAGDAGVSLTQSLRGNSVAAQTANQMIKNLIAGYGGMAAVSTALGQDINAVSFASAIQNGNVAKLNQSWDTFISTVQAPSSTFLAFAQSLQQFNSDAQKAGAQMSGLGGATVTASHSVSNASIQLQQDFNSSVTSAEQMLNSMRTVAAITGNGGPLVAGIKDTVAALIPMAGSNEGARAQLFALAQEAGGPASGSLQSLARWAGNTKDPLGNLYTLAMQAAGAIQKLGADTQALAATMQSSLNQTLVTQAQNLTGVNQKTATYLQDLQKYGPAAAVTQAALANLNDAQSQANSLASTGASSISFLSGKQQQYGQALTGAQAARQQLNQDIQGILNRAPGASGDVNALMTAVENQGSRSSAAHGARQQLITDLENAGATAQTATGMVDGLISAIAGLHSKTVTITTITNAVQQPGSSYVPPVGKPLYQKGALVPGGYGGGDIVPAMLEPGEAVVPKHLVGYVAPFLSAHHVPGFAGGGVAGPVPIVNKPPPLTGMEKIAALWAAEIWGQDHRRFGRHHPIGLAEMRAILAASEPGRGFLPRTALAGLLGLDERRDFGRYYTEDVSYWKVLGQRHALSVSSQRQIKALEDRIAHARRNDSLSHAAHLETEYRHLEGQYANLTAQIKAAESDKDKHPDRDDALVRRLLRERARIAAEGHRLTSEISTIKSNYALVHGHQLANLETASGRKFAQYSEQIEALADAMGYSRGGRVPYGSYDRGGYLPVGLSMAYNGTGKPEPVGGGGKQEVHVHLHGDLAQSELWDRMQVRTLDYGYLNSGRPAGLWQPGG